LFEDNPYNPQLANHGLKGKYLGYRSISIGSDLRALYTIRGDTIILFAFIGSHSQLY
jgi:addiction module RelE/StbE family toxin